MKRWSVILLVATIAASMWGVHAEAWTLPVPSGMVAGDQVRALDGSTLKNYSQLSMTCTSLAVDNTTALPVSGVSCYLLSAAGTSVTLASVSETGAEAGQLLVIINSGSNAFTINESSGVTDQAGNVALGALDSIVYLYTGSSWVQISASNN